MQDSLRSALKLGTLPLPGFEAVRSQVTEILRKLAGRLDIKNADDRCQVRPREAVLHSPEFKALWDRIKHQTTYRVQFDNEKLVESCIGAVRNAPAIAKTRLQWRKAEIAIGKAGVEATERAGAATVVLDEGDIVLPDRLTELQDRRAPRSGVARPTSTPCACVNPPPSTSSRNRSTTCLPLRSRLTDDGRVLDESAHRSERVTPAVDPPR